MKKFAETINNNKKEIFGIAFIELMLFLAVRYIMAGREGEGFISQGTLSLIVYVVFCGGFIVAGMLINLASKKLKTEQIFLIMFLCIGLAYMVITPLSSTPDETEHFLRAYGIAQGDLVPMLNEEGQGGSYVPENLIFCWNRGASTLSDMVHHLRMVSKPEKVFLTYSNTALYSPLTYLPQAIGVFIAKIIFNMPYLCAYAGRFCELFTVGILLYFAIKITPIGKDIIFVLSMLPINMYECASLSGGGLAFAVIILLVAYTLYLRFTHEGEMNWKEKLYLYLLLLFVASCKIVYVPFVFMAFIIHKEKFGTNKKYFFHIGCAAVMILLASVGWVGISSRYLIEYNEGVSSVDQVKYILKNPFSYLQVIMNTIIHEGDWIIKTFFAGYLGYFDVSTDILMIFTTGANLIYVCVTSSLVLPYKVTTKELLQPFVMLAVSVAVSLAFVLTSLYVQWNPVAATYISGLQGRYFLPLMYPFILLIKRKYNKEGGLNNDAKNDKGFKFLIVFVNFLVIVTLLVRYA